MRILFIKYFSIIEYIYAVYRGKYSKNANHDNKKHLYKISLRKNYHSLAHAKSSIAFFVVRLREEKKRPREGQTSQSVQAYYKVVSIAVHAKFHSLEIFMMRYNVF